MSICEPHGSEEITKNMANLTLDEFGQCLTVLADGRPPEKLRDQLCRMNAFHSRRGLGSIEALTSRLYQLTAGLRRQVPATHAFQALWAEYVGKRLNEEVGKKLDELADKINEQLDGAGGIQPGREVALEECLTEYETLLARRIGGTAARLDTLQKAYPSVADILRARAVPDVALDPPDEHDHDHEGHHHHHDH